MDNSENPIIPGIDRTFSALIFEFVFLPQIEFGVDKEYSFSASIHPYFHLPTSFSLLHTSLSLLPTSSFPHLTSTFLLPLPHS
ncbi:hypothetical protein OU792_18370 [Algoriphagus sp. NF]|uniref:hypothetical protein n=1 Tax=Algoriphagus sp. NF TaxID=2992756 RepID=UPI00237B0BE2|nr:hypothetical protein [Algoriphagus sp. NF]MDE0561969.1 hypothetical protein [Algoriphagus sp. NF]